MSDMWGRVGKPGTDTALQVGSAGLRGALLAYPFVTSRGSRPSSMAVILLTRR